VNSSSARPRWLVDGMNVIGSRPTGWWRDRPGAMRELVRELAAFATARSEPLTVVFDGRPVELEARGVEVAFARRGGRDAADDEIVRMVERDAAPGELRVVTSDAGLAARVRPLGAQIVTAGTFRRLLDDAGC
jgi:predicted RNA-binding protein with PIN domain